MNEFLNILASNAIEFAFAILLAVITCFLIPWARSTAAPFIAGTVVPWLKEKRLYGIVKHFVEAAEKLSENNTINKKEYVVHLLESKGIEITDEVEAYIESAVINLDRTVSEMIDVITEAPVIEDKEKPE